MPRFTHLSELLAAQPKSATALRAPDRRPLSYADLSQVVEQTLSALNGWGIGRGDRVAMVLPNGPEMAAAFIAVATAATAAPLNPAYRSDEFEFYMTDLRAKALLVEQGSASPAVAVAERLGLTVIELAPSAAGAGAFTLTRRVGSPALVGASAASPGAAGPDDIALILHTSGTTSRPKIVPLSQRNVCASAGNVQAPWR
jgi:acyl-CoA synthetase (AMP-forming)/AMP-acid ligase II